MLKSFVSGRSHFWLPWKMKGSAICAVKEIQSKDPVEIAIVYMSDDLYYDGMICSEGTALANLFLAAPYMYEALKLAVDIQRQLDKALWKFGEINNKPEWYILAVKALAEADKK